MFMLIKNNKDKLVEIVRNARLKKKASKGRKKIRSKKRTLRIFRKKNLWLFGFGGDDGMGWEVDFIARRPMSC